MTPSTSPPPPEVEEALRSRITQFYDLFKEGKFREAEQFVAEDSRESYYSAQKGRVLGFSIKKIDFGFDFKTAQAMVTLKTVIPFAGSAPVDLPVGTEWAWTEGSWFMVLPRVRPGDQIQTPFGTKTIGPETAGMPESPESQFGMPDKEALKKMYLEGAKQARVASESKAPAASGSKAPAASERKAPRTRRSILSYSLVQTQSKTPEEFIVSLTGTTIRIVPGALGGWVDAVRQQTGGTRFSGWASDGAHRKRVQQVVVFVDGQSKHERHTPLSRPDVAGFFKFPPLRRAGFRVELPVSVFDQDPAPIVRVFAVSKTRVASELSYRPEYHLDGGRTVKLGKGSTVPPIQSTTPSYSLVQTGSGTSEESIVSLTGTTIGIVPDAVDGWVDAVRQRREGTLFSGWASDQAYGGPAHQVLVFVDGEVNHEPHSTWSRPGVAKVFKAPSLLDAGFHVVVPGSVFDRNPAPVVRVFATSVTGEASELRYHPKYADGPRTVKLGND